MYSLIEIMTLESWSMGIVRPVMQDYPYAWLFFKPFILFKSFMVLNLFIGIIVDAIATVKEQEQPATPEQMLTRENIEIIRRDISVLNCQLGRLLETLTSLKLPKGLID